jgi:hypothetical protein
MNTRTRLVVLSIVGFVGVAHAEDPDHGTRWRSELFTSVVWLNNDTLVTCSVLNASQRPRKITVELFRNGGPSFPSISEDSDCDQEVLPGNFCTTIYTNRTRGSEAIYCKVTVDGYKTNVRASLGIRAACNVPGSTCETTLDVEAR